MSVLYHPRGAYYPSQNRRQPQDVHCSMSLLSDTEAAAFQNFLSTVNVDPSMRDGVASEWSLYNDQHPNNYDENQREHLARATKDLLALNSPSGHPDGMQDSAGYHSPSESRTPPVSSRGQAQDLYGGHPSYSDRRDSYDPFPPFQRGDSHHYNPHSQQQPYPPPIFTHNMNHMGPASSQASSPPSSLFSSMSSGSTSMSGGSYDGNRLPFGGHGPQYQNQHPQQHDHGFLLPPNQRSPHYSSHSPILRSPHPLRTSPPEHLRQSPPQNGKRPHSDQHDLGMKRHRGHSISEESGNSSLMASTMALTGRSDEGSHHLKHEDMGPPDLPPTRQTRSSSRLNKVAQAQQQPVSDMARRATVHTIRPSAPVPAPPPLPRRNSMAGPSAADTPSFASLSTFKPTLLSPSQKKANHIQSEQKRRANIRRGYEALCECVPILREACREEDEANARRDPADGPVKGRGRAKKGGRKSVGVEEGGEKLDGRAGPRSENIVLGKTIDYITDLKSEHDVLLERLERARQSLGPQHPELDVPPMLFSTGKGPSVPMWEREWTGGEGRSGDDEDDEE